MLRNDKARSVAGLGGCVMVLLGLEVPAFLVWKAGALCVAAFVWRLVAELLRRPDGRGFVGAQAQEIGQGEPAELRDGRLHGGAAHVHDVPELRGGG